MYRRINILIAVAVAAGVSSAAVAVIAPWIGLGTQDNFVLYVLAGIARRDLFFMGLGIAGLSLFLKAGAILLIYFMKLSRDELRSVAINLTLVFASSVVSLVGLELALRATYNEWTSENYIQRKINFFTTHAAAEYDPILGWTLRSDLRGPMTSGEFGIRMNSDQVRSPPHGGILAVGDSFTAGSEVENHETWPAHLESITGVNTVNGAVGGWGTDQIVLRAEALSKVINPKIVILSFFSHDILRSEFKTFGGGNKPYFTVSEGRLVHHNLPVPPFSVRPSELGWARSIFGYSYLIDWIMQRIGYADWTSLSDVSIPAGNDGAEVTCLLLDRVRQDFAARDIRLILILQYAGGDIRFSRQPPSYVNRVYDCALKLGIETANTWDPLRSHLAANGEDGLKKLFVMHDRNRNYGHMSSEGNKFIAELLAKKIAAPAR